MIRAVAIDKIEFTRFIGDSRSGNGISVNRQHNNGPGGQMQPELSLARKHALKLGWRDSRRLVECVVAIQGRASEHLAIGCSSEVRDYFCRAGWIEVDYSQIELSIAGPGGRRFHHGHSTLNVFVSNDSHRIGLCAFERHVHVKNVINRRQYHLTTVCLDESATYIDHKSGACNAQ